MALCKLTPYLGTWLVLLVVMATTAHTQQQQVLLYSDRKPIALYKNADEGNRSLQANYTVRPAGDSLKKKTAECFNAC